MKGCKHGFILGAGQRLESFDSFLENKCLSLKMKNSIRDWICLSHIYLV